MQGQMHKESDLKAQSRSHVNTETIPFYLGIFIYSAIKTQVPNAKFLSPFGLYGPSKSNMFYFKDCS